MAVSGETFLASGKKSFILHLKHTFQFDKALTFTSFYLFMSKIALIIINLWLLDMMLTFFNDYNRITSWINIYLVVGLSSWLSCEIFIGIFEKTVVALIMCLSIDLDLNNGRPKNGSPKIHKLFGQILKVQETMADD